MKITKKIIVILAMIFTTVNLLAPSAYAKSFSVICFVTDDADGDQKVVNAGNAPFTISTTEGGGTAAGGIAGEAPSPKSFSTTDGKTFTNDFGVKGSNHNLQVTLEYNNEDRIFVLSVGDLDDKVVAETVGNIPDHMYARLGTEQLSLIAQCNLAVVGKQDLRQSPQQMPYKTNP